MSEKLGLRPGDRRGLVQRDSSFEQLVEHFRNHLSLLDQAVSSYQGTPWGNDRRLMRDEVMNHTTRVTKTQQEDEEERRIRFLLFGE